VKTNTVELLEEKVEPFERYAGQYENWFEQFKMVYQSEVEALHSVKPTRGTGIEIGVGSGRFAAPLDIRYGLDPSKSMLDIAQQRGIDVQLGVAERLPYRNRCIDFVVMVTTLCFLGDVRKAFREAHRILTPSGDFILGYIDKRSPIGKQYLEIQSQDVFYRVASFYSTEEVLTYLKNTGFSDFVFAQTLFHPLDEINEIEPVKSGYGEGSFVAIRANKKKE